MLENVNIVQLIIGAWVVWALIPLLLGLTSVWLNVAVREDKYKLFTSFQNFKFARFGAKAGWGAKDTTDAWFAWIFLDIMVTGFVVLFLAFLCKAVSPYIALGFVITLTSPFIMRTLLDLKKGLAYSAESGKLKRLEEIEKELKELKSKGVSGDSRTV